LQEYQKSWEYPIWRHRSGRLNQLLQWTIRRSSDLALERGDSIGDFENAVYQGVRFAEDLHSALNPEGHRLAIEGAIPARDIDGGKPHFAWTRQVGNVWNHAPPEDSVPVWQRALVEKRLVHFPTGCNVEAVINILDEYARTPHLRHPWIDWMLFDALIRAAVIATWDGINFAEADLFGPARRRKGIGKILFASADRARQAKILAQQAPHRRALDLMLKTYSAMDSGGWTLSPTRMRQLMDAAEASGGLWPPAAYVLIDRAIAADPGVWMFEPP
jgi:hypothetical protein